MINMITIIITVIYALVAIEVSHEIYDMYKDGYLIDVDCDKVEIILLGILAGLAWPITIALMWYSVIRHNK